MALNTPDSDPSAFRGTSPGLRLILFMILSLGLMVLDYQNQHLKNVRRFLEWSVYPLQVAVNAPAALGRWASESLSTRVSLIEDNETMRRKILIQSGHLQRMAALEAENARLRALLESTAKVGERVLIAEIMSVDMNPFRHQIIVNKGSKDGAFEGQALIDAQGVVGQITRDQIIKSEAILITDADHAVPVEIVRNQLRTIAMGTGDRDYLSLPFLPRNGDVRRGDLLVTSGLGGTFPAGYPVAMVDEVLDISGEPFLTVTATPTAALNRVREVLLLWPGEETPLEIPLETPLETPLEPAAENEPDGDQP